MKFFIILVSFVFIIPAFASGQEQKQEELQVLIQEAIQNNPRLRAARNNSEAAKTRINQATSWEAPQFGVEFFKVPVQSFPNPLKNNMEMDYSLQQMIPFPGKLSAMGTAAESNAAMADEGYKALERKVIRDLKSAYYDLYLVQHKIEINTENRDLMRSFVDIAKKQYEVGMGKQADILRSQTELSTLINDGINLQQEKQVVEAMLNTILSRPVNLTFGYVSDIDKNIPQWTFEQLRPIALETRAELKAMNYNIDMNKAELSLSKREYFPDLMTRVMYKDMAKTGNDFWSLMIGISIPLTPWSGSKYTSKVEENEINVRKAEEEYSNMKNMTLYEVQSALVKVQTNRNLVLLYKNTVIPQAEQTLQSTISAYQTGKTEFLMLIDAYRMVLMSKLDYHMTVMNYMSSQAALEQAMGMDVAQIAEKVH